MKKNLWQLIIPVFLVVLTMIVYGLMTREKDTDVEIVRVEKAVFEILVGGTGELEALKSTNILIPDVLGDRRVRIRSIAIHDMVREGTVVSKGDYVATLDPSEVEERIRRTEEAIESWRTNLDNAKIDSSLVLSGARDEIRQAHDLVLDQEIRLEQSVYESEAVQRQAQIAYESSLRSLDQRKRNYTQQVRRYKANVDRAAYRLADEEETLAVLLQLKQDLVIRAPGDGLVVYARGGNGEKIKAGTHVNRWFPLIATLPDLASLQSVVYIKEIDISRVKPGMLVRVKIDAFPDEEFEGVVTRVANVGQEVPGEFFSAFKVEVRVDPNGKLLLPGMTSFNQIVLESFKDALVVPRLAVYNDSTLQQYVYKRVGLSDVVKQQVRTSGENDNYFRVVAGLSAGDRVMLYAPNDEEKIKIRLIEDLD